MGKWDQCIETKFFEKDISWTKTFDSRSHLQIVTGLTNFIELFRLSFRYVTNELDKPCGPITAQKPKTRVLDLRRPCAFVYIVNIVYFCPKKLKTDHFVQVSFFFSSFCRVWDHFMLFSSSNSIKQHMYFSANKIFFFIQMAQIFFLWKIKHSRDTKWLKTS